MKLASLVALVALTGFMASEVAAASDSDAPKSTEPNASQNKPRQARRRAASETKQHPVPIDVRVVLESDSKKRVAAQVLCLPLEAMQPDFVFIRDESHEDRDLNTTRTACPMLVRAETKDARLGGIVQITPDETQIVIPVGPTATLRGRLIDQSTGQPIVNQQITYGVKVIFPPERFSLWGFGNGAHTDNQGKFTLPGMVPRWKFDLTTWTKPENGPAKSWNLGAVTPRYPGIIDLGDIKLGAPDERPRRGQPRPTREPIFHPGADAQAELAKALKIAGEENKRVLVLFGGNWSEWCFKLNELLAANAEIEPLVKKGFVVVLVDANANRKLLESYAVHDSCRGFPFVVILDASGNVLTKQNTDELEAGPKHDVKKVKAFLTKWSLAH
jgi:thioredoxin family protein